MFMKSKTKIEQIVLQYGKEIIFSDHMQTTKQYRQHKTSNVFEHSVNTAGLCVFIALQLGIKTDLKALVRGALLHDYFLYDWHVPDPSHRLHGFTHAGRALRNAEQDFCIGPIERDMIAKHMFPLNIAPPQYKESVILCIADKICALCEILSVDYFNFKIRYSIM